MIDKLLCMYTVGAWMPTDSDISKQSCAVETSNKPLNVVNEP